MGNREKRTKRRKDWVNLVGSRQLRYITFTMTCQKPNPKDHKTCLGLEADCLCPCHDD